ncbi:MULTISPECIES: glycerol-3-phosphate dehydrogenase/oxidase [Allobacillus]|uniref:Glycerol-3-phosphate dehydrogenase n=1 Tax=Allobacillus salarius TaxID=1955272 RepID=A0A556PMK9_9BACI|nr:FAD-dependent oxidoreductase [Allobacillus salarius]TSJ65626.1 glycerol-3-phosphate dehydrogenase/oxidase [Allobacillus salarius]
MFSNLQRAAHIEELKNEQYDVLIIGGGITGAGIALDAATRGMKTALIEMQDFAAGTSSRSTKLVHGGLRYLKQFDIKVVSETGKERAIVYENGPHVTTPQWMLLPFYKDGSFGKLMTSFGLRLYDFLANVKKSERRVMFDRDETLNKEPLLKKDGLKGGGYYVEYRTDDARLTLEVMKAAVEHGAKAINYTKANQLLYNDGKIIGVSAKDQLTGEKYEIHAKKVINATGPWVDQVRDLDQSKDNNNVILTKGVHIVFDQERFLLKQSIYFDTEKDKRMIFAIPRDKKVYIGTTDTFYKGNLEDPNVTEEDIDYLLEAVNYMFPSVEATKKDIESTWAGLRPLILEEGKDPSEISRKDEILESDSGLISIAGGKLTGYRKMAETIVDLVTKKFNQENISFGPCKTKHLPISGGEVGGSQNMDHFVEASANEGIKYGFAREDAKHLARLYGSNVTKVYELYEQNAEVAEKYDLTSVDFAELLYGIEYEMVATPIDFFYRRVSTLLFNIDSVKQTKEQVCKYMADRFNWSDELKSSYMKELDEEIRVRVNG